MAKATKNGSKLLVDICWWYECHKLGVGGQMSKNSRIVFGETTPVLSNPRQSHQLHTNGHGLSFE